MTLQRSNFAARLSPPLSTCAMSKFCLFLSVPGASVSCLRLSGFLFQHLRRALTLSFSLSYSARRCPEGEVHRCLGGVGHTQGQCIPERPFSLAGRWLQLGREAAHLRWTPSPQPGPLLGHLVIPGRKWLGAAERGTGKRCRLAFELRGV